MSDVAPITKERSEAALAALLGYQQSDEDGVMVLASRQAIHEVAARLTELEAALKEAGEALDRLAQIAAQNGYDEDSRRARSVLQKIKAAGV